MEGKKKRGVRRTEQKKKTFLLAYTVDHSHPGVQLGEAGLFYWLLSWQLAVNGAEGTEDHPLECSSHSQVRVTVPKGLSGTTGKHILMRQMAASQQFDITEQNHFCMLFKSTYLNTPFFPAMPMWLTEFGWVSASSKVRYWNQRIWLLQWANTFETGEEKRTRQGVFEAFFNTTPGASGEVRRSWEGRAVSVFNTCSKQAG